MEPIFKPELIVADKNGRELNFVRENILFDLDIGDTYDFELRLDMNVWNREKFWYDYRIYIPGTEYGGIMQDLEVITKTNEIVFRGDTWRGMLRKKVVEPPSGSSHLILSGELNDVVRMLVGDQYEGLFMVDHVNSGITVTNWVVDRYVLLYDAIMKLVGQYGYRLQVNYNNADGEESGIVHLCAVPVVDWSDDLEYSQDNRLHFDIRDCRSGINHLICAGKGENEQRIILHFYVQKDGSIGQTQYYKGLSEKAAVYEFTSADEKSLREYGIKQLQALQNFKKINLSISNADLELGDIVGGRERITGITLNKPIIRKILKISKKRAVINYEIKGDD